MSCKVRLAVQSINNVKTTLLTHGQHSYFFLFSHTPTVINLALTPLDIALIPSFLRFGEYVAGTDEPFDVQLLFESSFLDLIKNSSMALLNAALGWLLLAVVCLCNVVATCSSWSLVFLWRFSRLLVSYPRSRSSLSRTSSSARSQRATCRKPPSATSTYACLCCHPRSLTPPPCVLVDGSHDGRQPLLASYTCSEPVMEKPLSG